MNTSDSPSPAGSSTPARLTPSAEDSAQLKSAIILAAGRGERLRPRTDKTPKPMLPLAGKPLIEHQIQWLAAAGLRIIVINLFHLGQQIEDHLGDGAAFGVAIRYSREEVLLDTGGGILQALPLLAGEDFLVLNGDIWTDFDFARLTRPLAPGTEAHLVLTPTPAHRSGDFDLQDGRVLRRAESPFVYCGIARLSRRLFDTPCARSHIQDISSSDARVIQPFSLADLYFEAVDRGTLSGEIWPGRWFDIGSPNQLAAVEAQI